MLSGSTGTQLMAALRFLRLIDANGKPTERLKSLVLAKAEQKTQILHEIATESYDFILRNSIDLESATYSQLEEAFQNTFQLADDVRRKCVKFFIAMASDAGMVLSPFITKRIRLTHTSSGTKITTKRTVNRTNRKAIVPQNQEGVPNQLSWNDMLLAKFPSFDPAWNDELKLKWFAAFDELLKRGAQRG
jgi:hypothetical protein